MPGGFGASVPHAGSRCFDRVACCQSAVCVVGGACDFPGRTAGSCGGPDPLIGRNSGKYMKRVLQIFAESGNNFNFGAQYLHDVIFF